MVGALIWFLVAR